MLNNNETIRQAAKSAPMLSKELEARSAISWQRDGDYAARELLYRSHLRLLIRIVGRMKAQSARFDDLLSAGSIGLLVAIDRFDPETGFRLSTYASFWIRSHVNEDVYTSTNAVRLPSSEKFKRTIAHYHDARRRLGIERDGRLTYRETVAVASLLEVPVEIAEVVDARHDGWAISMQSPTAWKDGPGTFGDRFESSDPSPHLLLAERQKEEWAKNLISLCLKSLRPREQEVFLRRRLSEEWTLQDLAEEYGLTRQRVQQIEMMAVRKFTRAALQHKAAARIHLNMPDDV